MKAKSLSSPGYYDLYKNYQWISTTKPSGHYTTQISCGPIVKGDFKAPNNWFYNVLEELGWQGTTHQKNSLGDDYTYRGKQSNLAVPMVKPSWDQSDVYNQALSRLNEKVRGALDLSIALAEARTTARMVKSLSKVIGFARAVKRRFGSTKDIANGWLQWQYGWKPLASDLFGILDESTNIIQKGVYRTYASATRRIYVNETVLLGIPNNPSVRVIRKGMGKQSCRLHVAVNVGGWDPGRFSSLNPISIAWELLPYSFIFDWFVDIGSYMRDLETGLLYGTAFHRGYRSDLYVYDGTEETDPAHVRVSSGTAYWSICDRSCRYRRFARTVMASYPLPYPPKFKADLGSERLLTTAALLRQILR